MVDLNAQEVVEMEAFNQFIDSIKVMEKFIWFRPNGQSMSRLDRLLGLSFGQWVLDRDISDYIPLSLRNVVQNCGTKPFRVLNCCFHDLAFRYLVVTKSKGFQVYG